MQVYQTGTNDVNKALTDFHIWLHKESLLHRRSRVREFHSLVKTEANEIKSMYRDSTQKGLIRMALKFIVKQLQNVCVETATGNRVDLDAICQHYFGGELLSTQRGRFYDLATRKDLEELEVWFFRPDDGQCKLQPNAIKGIREAEEQFKLRCSDVRVLTKMGFVSFVPNIDTIESECTIKETEPDVVTKEIDNIANNYIATQPILPDLVTEQGAENNSKNKMQPPTISLVQPNQSNAIVPEQSQAENSSESDSVTYIGWIRLREGSPFILSQRKDEIPGYLKREYIDRVNKGDWLVLENEKTEYKREESVKVYAILTSIETYNKVATALTKSVDETVHGITLRPYVEVMNGKEGPVKAHDLDHYQVRMPTHKELQEILNLPQVGFPIGWVQYYEPLVVRYPNEPEDTVYQSVIVAGVQRSGKTNLLKLLTRSLVTYRQIPLEKRPALLILDVEGAFRNIPKLEKLDPQASEWLHSNLLSDFEHQVIQIGDDPNQGDTTIDLGGIRPEDLTYLLPELPPKSDTLVEEMIRECSRRLANDLTVLRLRDEIIREVRNSQIIHREQAGAIIRAFYSPSMRLFDQPSKRPVTVSEILKPGKVTVVDIFSLSDGQKRAVALYFLLMFDYYKMNSAKIEPGLLLLVDEAHRFFPKKAPSREKEHVERVSSRISDIVHRGRKRKYGVVLATQSPSDLNPLVTNLCNTKIAFRLSGADHWVKEYFGNLFIEEVKSLPTGTCLINFSGTGLSIPTVKITTPNVTEA